MAWAAAQTQAGSRPGSIYTYQELLPSKVGCVHKARPPSITLYRIGRQACICHMLSIPMALSWIWCQHCCPLAMKQSGGL